MSPRYRYVRWFVTTAALFTLIVAIILTVPPLRAIAQDILRQIGIYNVTNAPTSYELSQLPIPVVELARGGSEWHPIAQDTGEADFNWLAMLETMPDGFDTVTRGIESNLEKQIGYFTTRYTRTGDPDIEVRLNQMHRFSREKLLDFTAGGAQTEAVEINGEQGFWVSRFSDAADVDVQMLIWHEDVYRQNDALLVWLTGRGIGKDEMLIIARAVILRDPMNVSQPIISRSDPSILYRPLSQLAAEIEFDVAVPQYVPELMRLTWRHTVADDDFGQFSARYSGFLRKADGLYRSEFAISQFKAKTAAQLPAEFALGETPFEDVTVNGHPGIWVEDAALYSENPQHYLLWEQYGFTLHLSADVNLPREEIFRIAESLTFIGPDGPDSVTEQMYTNKLLPAEVVSAKTDFPIAELEFVPEGYVLRTRDARRMTEVTTATTTYKIDRDTLVLIQSKYQIAPSLRELALGDAWLEEVTVNRRPGYWIANYQTYPDDRIGMLIWEQGGFIYRLQSAALGRDELLRVAESLKYVGSPDF